MSDNRIQQLFDNAFLLQFKSEKTTIPHPDKSIEKQEISISPYVIKPQKGTNQLAKLVGADLDDQGKIERFYQELPQDMEHQILVWRVIVKSTGKHSQIGNFVSHEQVMTHKFFVTEDIGKMEIFLRDISKAKSIIGTIEDGLQNGTVELSDAVKQSLEDNRAILAEHDKAFLALEGGMRFIHSFDHEKGNVKMMTNQDINIICPSIRSHAINMMRHYYNMAVLDSKEKKAYRATI